MTRSSPLKSWVCQDQRRRWQGGGPLRVEDYLERYPVLWADADSVLRWLRQRAGP